MGQRPSKRTGDRASTDAIPRVGDPRRADGRSIFAAEESWEPILELEKDLIFHVVRTRLESTCLSCGGLSRLAKAFASYYPPITNLTLTSCGLVGSLSPEVVLLKMLSFLDVSENNLVDVDCVSSLSCLTELRVQHNCLKRLPSDIQRAKGLTRLDASHNCLTSLPMLDGLDCLTKLMTSCNGGLQPELEVWIVSETTEQVKELNATNKAFTRVKMAMLAWMLTAKHLNNLVNRDVR
jgi:hypothetical protein